MECYLMGINATIELFAFTLAIIWLITGCTIVKSLGMAALGLVTNHSLIPLGVFVAAL